MIVGLYARVSTDEQRERQTIKTQLEYARSRATLEGWSLREFTDDGISGTVPLAQRPGGRALLAAARAGEFEVVATYRLDRLGRTQRVVLDAIDQLKAAGARYRSLTEPFEVGTPFGDAALGMTSVFAQLERDSIAQRTKEGRRRAARDNDRYLGGPAGYGYRVEGTQLVIDEAQAAVIREIYRLYLDEELGVDAIAAELNRREIPAPRGGRWHVSMVGRLLRMPRSSGHETFAGVIERRLPAIVSGVDYARARERAAHNYRWKRAHARRAYLFRGMLRCECGLLMTAHTYDVTRDGRKTQKAYRCSYAHRLATKAPTVKEDQALAAMWSDVERFVSEPGDLVRRIVASDPHDEQRAEKELLELATRLLDVRQRESRLLDTQLRAAFSVEVLTAKGDDLRREREAIQARMAKVRSARNVAAVAETESRALRARLLELRRRARVADDATKAAVLRELIRDVRVEFVAPGRCRLRLAWVFAQTDAYRAAASGGHIQDASEQWSSLETVHELGRAA